MGEHKVEMARWVRTTSRVLECQLEKAGPHSVGDREVIAASNGSSNLGRLSWQQLKSAI